MTELNDNAATESASGEIDSRYGVVPFYKLDDESGSMKGEPVNAINEQTPSLINQVRSDPAVCDKARFGMISFDDDARVLLPLSDLENVSSVPALSAGGSTNYAAAFETLREQIVADVGGLAKSYDVFRPVVFFQSDGKPNGPDWRPAYLRLTGPEFDLRPHIIAFGVGNADPNVIAQVGTLACYQADEGVDPAEALVEIAKRITQSIIDSTATASAGGAKLVPPPTPEGFHSLQPQPVDLDVVATA